MDDSLLDQYLLVFGPFLSGFGFAAYSLGTLKSAPPSGRSRKLRNASLGFGLMGVGAVMCMQLYAAYVMAFAGAVTALISLRMWKADSENCA